MTTSRLPDPCRHGGWLSRPRRNPPLVGGLLGTFPDFRAEIRELHDLGEVTLTVLRMRGHAAGSETPVDATAWQVTQFRESKCIGWRVYTSEREALEAVGLSE
jgi:hypothetical protein